MRGRNLIQLLLVLTLVIASAALTVPLGSLETAISQPVTKRVSIQTFKFGSLMVEVLLGRMPAYLSGNVPTYFAPLDVGRYFVPIPNETVTISASNVTAGPRMTMSTNSSGLLVIGLPVGNGYLISVNDYRFHIEFPVNIYEGRTTRAVVGANMLAYEVFFQDLPDRYSSGWLVRGENAFLNIQSGVRVVSPSSTVFLQTESEVPPSANPSRPPADLMIEQTRVTVTAEQPRQFVDWLQIEPEQNIRVTDIIGMVLITYRPTYSVTVQGL